MLLLVRVTVLNWSTLVELLHLRKTHYLRTGCTSTLGGVAWAHTTYRKAIESNWGNGCRKSKRAMLSKPTDLLCDGVLNPARAIRAFEGTAPCWDQNIFLHHSCWTVLYQIGHGLTHDARRRGRLTCGGVLVQCQHRGNSAAYLWLFLHEILIRGVALIFTADKHIKQNVSRFRNDCWSVPLCKLVISRLFFRSVILQHLPSWFRSYGQTHSCEVVKTRLGLEIWENVVSMVSFHTVIDKQLPKHQPLSIIILVV